MTVIFAIAIAIVILAGWGLGRYVRRLEDEITYWRNRTLQAESRSRRRDAFSEFLAERGWE